MLKLVPVICWEIICSAGSSMFLWWEPHSWLTISRYWGYDFDFDRTVIDIKSPGGIDPLADDRRRHKHHVIMLRDPFIREKVSIFWLIKWTEHWFGQNITGSIGGKAVDEFQAACREAYGSGLAELWKSVDLHSTLPTDRKRKAETSESDREMLIRDTKLFTGESRWIHDFPWTLVRQVSCI